MITITYYGVLQDELNLNSEELIWSEGMTDKLVELLRNRDDKWQKALAPDKIFRVVVNEEICFAPVLIKSGDRVALLPPVTGG